MRMAKPSRRDIDAAGDAMAILSNISSGYYPGVGGPSYFDEDDHEHLRSLYDLLNETLDRAPGWPGRVIGGMCYVICWDRNQILDPALGHLELHPDLLAGLKLLKAKRANFLPSLEQAARAAVAETIKAAAAHHLAEMRIPAPA